MKSFFLKTKKGESLIGSPTVKDIVIKAKVIDQIKDKKIICFLKRKDITTEERLVIGKTLHY